MILELEPETERGTKPDIPGPSVHISRTGSVDIRLGCDELALSSVKENHTDADEVDSTPAPPPMPSSERVLTPSPVNVPSKSFSFEAEKEFWKSRRKALHAYSNGKYAPSPARNPPSHMWATPPPSRVAATVDSGVDSVDIAAGASLSSHASPNTRVQERRAEKIDENLVAEIELLKEKVRSQEVLIDVLKSSADKSPRPMSQIEHSPRLSSPHDFSDFGPVVLRENTFAEHDATMRDERACTAAYIRWFRTELRRRMLRGLDDIESEARRSCKREDGVDAPLHFRFQKCMLNDWPQKRSLLPRGLARAYFPSFSNFSVVLKIWLMSTAAATVRDGSGISEACAASRKWRPVCALI